MRFMVEGAPKQALTDEMVALLPEEVARGRELDAQGLRRALYLAADRSRVWQVFAAEAQDEVQRALESLPLYGVTSPPIPSRRWPTSS
jgi:muconolactone delta-isomerase